MNKPLLIAAAAGAAALLLLRRDSSDDFTRLFGPMGEENILTNAVDAVAELLPAPTVEEQSEAVYMADMNLQHPNVRAFLWMIRVSEGTAGPDGYRTIVGYSTFNDYSDHPRVLVDLPNLGIKSSAAGAYQFIRRTWDGVRKKLGLPDFSPTSQDLAAVELIRQRGALADVIAGRFEQAVYKCRREWASLPGAGYGQRENKLAALQAAYQNAGGTIA